MYLHIYKETHFYFDCNASVSYKLNRQTLQPCIAITVAVVLYEYESKWLTPTMKPR